MGLSVAVCLLVCYNRSHRSYLSENQKYGNNLCSFWDICHRTASLRKIVLRDFDLLFEGQTFQMLISETVRAVKKNVWEYFVDFDIFHRIVSLRKIVLRDRFILFEDKQCCMLICLKW